MNQLTEIRSTCLKIRQSLAVRIDHENRVDPAHALIWRHMFHGHHRVPFELAREIRRGNASVAKAREERLTIQHNWQSSRFERSTLPLPRLK